MTDIVESPFAIAPGTVQQGHKRVRAYSAGELVVDSQAPLLVWEHPYFPQYFFAEPDLEVELRPAGTGPRCSVSARSSTSWSGTASCHEPPGAIPRSAPPCGTPTG